MTTQQSPSQGSDPRARWRHLPTEPREWIKEKPVESSAASWTPELDTSTEAARYGN
ncbi:hypothetical protein HLB23_30530 [Nocardia uniformis]|uniref:Uncharacterized protein n=1 Tax=Nocardia uniformis TaxID=53432 RepID=A0A849CDB2_9NOCA|nr:hypothetical protein [Nocardia uniformis]NNH74137.1 hypothetical protein [Nocardia uniformis]